MLTTDALLIALTENLSFQNNSSILKKEKKILLSLSHQLKRNVFLTKKQANLLINILASNKENLLIMNPEEVSLIENPLWSQNFREIVPIKKIYFLNSDFNYLIVESTHDNSFRDKINKLKKIILGNTINVSTTKYKILCNEFNLLTTVNFFSKDGFIVSDEVKNLHEKIVKLVEHNSNYLDINSPQNSKILSCVTKEIIKESDRDLILLDKRIKYQYSFLSEKIENSLAFKIANRSKINVYIDEKDHTLEEVLESFTRLNRFPCLFVFNRHDVIPSLRILNFLKTYIEKTHNHNIGIYFRVDNSSHANKELNEFIKNNNFNKNLTSEIKIAGVASALLPKFFFTTNWYPESVINFSPTFTRSKTSIFCQRVDLIAHYGLLKPVAEKYYDIL